MQVAVNTVVTLLCDITDVSGRPLALGERITYLHGGDEALLPGLQAALLGKSIDDEVSLELSPEDAYGEYDARLVYSERRDALPPDVAIGATYQRENEIPSITGPLVYRVIDIDEANAVLDANHPLAGKTIRVHCRITNVEPATSVSAVLDSARSKLRNR